MVLEIVEGESMIVDLWMKTNGMSWLLEEEVEYLDIPYKCRLQYHRWRSQANTMPVLNIEAYIVARNAELHA